MAVAQQTSLPSVCGDLSVLLSIKTLQAAGLIESVVVSQFYMVAAMMVPITFPVATRISDRAFPPDRAIATSIFVLSYCGVWLFVGAVLLTAHLWALMALRSPLYMVCAITLLAAWHSTAWRQAMLNRSHSLRIVSAQRRAMIHQSLREGARAGLLCVPICAPAMLLAMSTGRFHVFVSAIVSAVLWAERVLPPERPIWGWRSWLRLVTKMWFLTTSTVRLARSILDRQTARSMHA